jgi:hypothetical protein
VKNVIYENGFRFWSNTSLPDEFQTEIDLNDELTIIVNDVPYSIKIPEGNYKTYYSMFESTLVDKINELLEQQDVPVRAKLGGIHDDNPRAVLVFEVFEYSEEAEAITISGISGTVAEIAQIVSPEPFAVSVPIPLPPSRVVMPNLHSSISVQIFRNSQLLGSIAVPQGDNSNLGSEMTISNSFILGNLFVGRVDNVDLYSVIIPN